jgi:hypothetical protein
MKEFFLSLTGALLGFLVALGLKWGESKFTQAAERRKEIKEREEKLDTSKFELEKVRESEKLDIARHLFEQNKEFREQEDETRKRIEALLSAENQRLREENFQLRQNLQTALLALKLMDKGFPNEKAVELGERLTNEIKEIGKD